MAPYLLVESVEVGSLQAAYQHHTKNYDCLYEEPVAAVLRRGQPFPVTIAFSNRPYDQDWDVIILTFSFGERPSVRNGTCAMLGVGPSGARCLNHPGARMGAAEWDVELHPGYDPSAGPLLRLMVEAAADCPVGWWKLEVKTRLRGDRTGQAGYYPHPQDIYILFNPWSKKDQVYMEDERYLDEYVLNDVGKIWMDRYRGREWVFGQFDACVLPAALQALRWSPLRDSQRGDPVKVTRAISRMVNSDLDRGILKGRWNGIYKDGIDPLAWTGSVAILREWLETGVEVKYGQCWVFAGVTATVCRALGIPTRVVTNLQSAQDTNESLTLDIYYDADFNRLENNPHNPPYYEADVDWNFHVWNDVWMARPDLPKGYGGWQAIDSSPLQLSPDTDGNGVSVQCGPASLEAIRCGAVGFNYDVRFMLSCVNADVFHWKEDPESDFGYSLNRVDEHYIGRMILTKAPGVFDPYGDRDREEITDQYKFKEGTTAERMALLNAVRSVDRGRPFYMLPTRYQDVEFSLVDLDKVAIGNDFRITINVHNYASEARRVRVMLTATSVYYTGVKAALIKRVDGEFSILPGDQEPVWLEVTVDEYLDKLVEYCLVKIAAIATVLDTNETWAAEDDFVLTRPPLVIRVESDTLMVGVAATITFSFKNPLRRRLTGCTLRYESPGLVRASVVELWDVEPEGEMMFQQQFTPIRAGEHKLVGTFSSKELVDITGSVAFDVLD